MLIHRATYLAKQGQDQAEKPMTKKLKLISIIMGAMISFTPPMLLAQEFDFDEYHRVTGIVDILDDEEAIEEFGLTESQQKMAKEAQKQIQEIAAMDKKTRADQFRAASLMLAIGKDFEAQLLPDQREDLNQAYYNMQVHDLRNFAFDDKFVIRQLRLSEDQQKKITEITAGFEQEMQKELEEIEKKINEVNEKHLDKALKILTPAQRKSYKDKFWPKNEFDRGIDPRKFFMDRRKR